MKKERIIELLKGYSEQKVSEFASYIVRTSMDSKNQKWMKGRTEEEMAELFKRVYEDGLYFDGVHITLQYSGISYDYVAYKNKMLHVYPESKIDINIVYKDDEFMVAKETGSVMYTHNISDPFEQKDENVKGAYCVIKNKRGEFLTTLTRDEIDKHRKVAKFDNIWKQWFKEMTMKTVIKKAVKYHYSDLYENIEKIDNENYELENPIDLDLKWKQEIEAIETIEELKEYYNKNKGQGKDFDKMVTTRKQELTKDDKE